MSVTLLLLMENESLIESVCTWLPGNDYAIRRIGTDRPEPEFPEADFALIEWVSGDEFLRQQLAQLRRQQPGCRCVMIVPPDRQVILSALRLAATGYLTSPLDKSALENCLLDIQHGNGYWDQQLLHLITHPAGSVATYPAGLSQREHELWGHLVNGLANQQIEELMCLSHSRVKNLKTDLAQKLNLSNAHLLTAYAVNWARGN